MSPEWTHVGHLNYGLYKRVQDYIHAGYAHQKAILLREFEAHGGRASVLELACGGGSLAETLPVEGYAGVDASAERIAAATRDHPGRKFFACDVNSPDFDEHIRRSDFIYCHGLLHHIDDGSCRGLLAKIKALAKKPATFVAIEPLLPKWWLNPAGYLVCKLDEGHFIRTSEAYKAFFEGLGPRLDRFTLFPRLPLDMEAYVVRILV